MAHTALAVLLGLLAGAAGQRRCLCCLGCRCRRLPPPPAACCHCQAHHSCCAPTTGWPCSPARRSDCAKAPAVSGKVPQFITITWDDAVDPTSYGIVQQIVGGLKQGKRGCPIPSTFFVTCAGEWPEPVHANCALRRAAEPLAGCTASLARWRRRDQPPCGECTPHSRIPPLPILQTRCRRRCRRSIWRATRLPATRSTTWATRARRRLWAAATGWPRRPASRAPGSPASGPAIRVIPHPRVRLMGLLVSWAGGGEGACAGCCRAVCCWSGRRQRGPFRSQHQCTELSRLCSPANAHAVLRLHPSARRAPFLLHSTSVRQALAAAGFQYDSSLPDTAPSRVSPNVRQRTWPYRMDAGIPQACDTGACVRASEGGLVVAQAWVGAGAGDGTDVGAPRSWPRSPGCSGRPRRDWCSGPGACWLAPLLLQAPAAPRSAGRCGRSRCGRRPTPRGAPSPAWTRRGTPWRSTSGRCVLRHGGCATGVAPRGFQKGEVCVQVDRPRAGRRR